MALIETGIPLTARTDYRDARLPIVPRGGKVTIMDNVGVRRYRLKNLRTQAYGLGYYLTPPYPFYYEIFIGTYESCDPFLVNVNMSEDTSAFQVVMPSVNIAYIDTYMTGDSAYIVGGNTYAHRLYFYLASLQIDTAENVTKYDDGRGTIIPLSATNYTTYSLQTMNTDAFTLEKLMKISNNDHITLNYIDADGSVQSVNLIRTSEAPTIERYPKMSSGSFSCKFVKA